MNTPHGNINENFTECYVGGLEEDIDDKSLYVMFSPFGRIASTGVKTDKQTGNSRGYGFVRFVDHACAVRAIQVLSFQQLFCLNY